MTRQRALPEDTAKPEAKVTAASVAAYLGSVALLAVVDAVDQVDLVAVLPPGWVQVLLVPLIPGLLAAAAGWAAPHTRRGNRVLPSAD